LKNFTKDIPIVIVNVSEDLVRVYDRFFRAAGLNIMAKFSNAQDMFSFFYSERPISVVLLDHTLPEMSGTKAAQELKKIRPNQKIILTTTEEPTSFNDVPYLDGVVRKPFTISEFLDVITEVVSPVEVKGSLMLDDVEEFEDLLQDILADSYEKLCAVRNPGSIRYGIDIPGHTPSYILSRSKGLEVFLITEVTPENVFFCQQLMVNQGIHVRHLDGLLANFSVWDEKYSVEGIQIPTNSSAMGHQFYSNLDLIVDKNQFLFERLWSIATPAEQKIRELEIYHKEDYHAVISGKGEVETARLNILRHANSYVDACIIPSLLPSVMEIGGIGEARQAAESRGVRFRVLTEVTKESAALCKRLFELEKVEVRDLPGIKGAFSLNEKELLISGASEDPKKNRPYTTIYSSLREFVDQHKAIFNILWSIAVPAPVKIREIEEEEINER